MRANEVSTTQYLDESNRCLHCAKPSCSGACPIGNDIPSFLKLVRDGALEKAVDAIGHPFGEVCGYICAHEQQCQGGCVLGSRGKSVNVGLVERSVFAQHPYKVQRKDVTLVGRKIAVVGGGVSGITFAVKTYENGADVTVFERNELLSTLKLIPEFRLPRQTLQRIERQIEGKFTVVKDNITSRELTKLQREYDLVYIATGASAIYRLGVEGEELATPYDKFLSKTMHQGKVVVIGGGNTAMDCARLAKRCGADVTVSYRRQRADMPAFDKEIADAVNDGVQFSYNVAPTKLSQKDGKLLLTLAKTVNQGRSQLTVTCETTVVECDTVVSALGSNFDKSIFGEIEVGNDARHPLANVCVGGDAVGGKTVAQAVADALKTAQEILDNLDKQ